MPEADNEKNVKDFYLDIPQRNETFFLKGCGSLDWGMKNRLARIFNPASGRTVMLAIDHGYFQGPTTGLKKPSLKILNSSHPLNFLMPNKESHLGVRVNRLRIFLILMMITKPLKVIRLPSDLPSRPANPLGRITDLFGLILFFLIVKKNNPF